MNHIRKLFVKINWQTVYFNMYLIASLDTETSNLRFLNFEIPNMSIRRTIVDPRMYLEIIRTKKLI